ncbi:MAG: 5-deoxy-glucuronate isomerase [Thermomicrobiales bacterium]
MAITRAPHELIVHSANPGAAGEIIHVTPESAGWEYCSLIVQRIPAGAIWSHYTDVNEVALVPLSGRCMVEAEGHSWEIGDRENVFSGKPWALYLPRESSFVVRAETDLELAVTGARADRHFPAKLVHPDDYSTEIRGAGNAARQIRTIIGPDFPADRLLVIEVITPSGNWSSYPPHKHDVSNLPAEADLEEIYYYRMDPEDGFALQRLYTEDGSFDAAWTIHNGDLLLVQEGYHAFAVAHGYHAYYLNVLAGDESVRTLQPKDDPRYGWVRGTWSEALNDGISTYHDIAERQNGPAGRRG